MPMLRTDDQPERFGDEETARRMEAGVRRALNTPPKPAKELIGKTERATAQREGRAREASQPAPMPLRDCTSSRKGAV